MAGKKNLHCFQLLVMAVDQILIYKTQVWIIYGLSSPQAARSVIQYAIFI